MRVTKTGWKTWVVITAMIVYAVVNIISVRSRLLQAETYRLELTAQAAQLREENHLLEQGIEQAGDAAVIEKIARSRLGLVRPGEKIFCDANS